MNERISLADKKTEVASHLNQIFIYTYRRDNKYDKFRK